MSVPNEEPPGVRLELAAGQTNVQDMGGAWVDASGGSLGVLHHDVARAAAGRCLKALSLKFGKDAEAKIGEQVNTFVGSPQAASPGGAIHDMLHFAAKAPSGHVAVIVSFIVAVVSGARCSFACRIHSTCCGTFSHAGVWESKSSCGIASWRASWCCWRSCCCWLILVTATLSLIVHRLGIWISGLSYLADTLASFLLSILLFASIFKILPDVAVDWPDVWFGAGVTAVLFILGKFGLTLYFRLAAVQNPYGAAGSLSALMIWIYYSAALMFLGGRSPAPTRKARESPSGRMNTPRGCGAPLSVGPQVHSGQVLRLPALVHAGYERQRGPGFCRGGEESGPSLSLVPGVNQCPVRPRVFGARK